MPAVSISSLLSSIVTFWQNLCITLSFPDIQMPEPLKQAIGVVLQFGARIMSYIPQLPNFDTRAYLVLMSLGIPFLLDIFTVWFTQPFFQSVFHVLDLVACGSLFYFIATYVFDGPKTIIYLVWAICVVYAICRIIYLILHRREPLNLKKIGDDVTNYFLDGIIPGRTETVTLQDINATLSKAISTVQLIPEVSPWWVTMLLILAVIVLLLVFMLLQGLLGIKVNIPATIKVFLPVILVPIVIIIFALIILKSTKAGAKISLKMQRFLKRWGLRLLMLFLEMSYIPILTNLVENLVPVTATCPFGQTLSVNYTESSDFDMFEKHIHVCIDANNASFTTLRLKTDLSLRYFKDVIYVNGGTILWTIFFILFGIPLLWYTLIRKNRVFVFSINVYGSDLIAKWKNLASRLKTTGIFLFQQYKVIYSRWSVYLLLSKVVVMLLSSLTNFFHPDVMYGLPIWYFFFGIWHITKCPYISNINNVIDFLLYLTNTFFYALPILPKFNIIVSKTVTTWISLCLMVLPVMATIMCLFFGTKPDPNENPTLMTEKFHKILEKMEKRKQARRRKMLRLKQHPELAKKYAEMEAEKAARAANNAPKTQQRSSNPPLSKSGSKGTLTSRATTKLAKTQLGEKPSNKRMTRSSSNQLRQYSDDDDSESGSLSKTYSSSEPTPPPKSARPPPSISQFDPSESSGSGDDYDYDYSFEDLDQENPEGEEFEEEEEEVQLVKEVGDRNNMDKIIPEDVSRIEAGYLDTIDNVLKEQYRKPFQVHHFMLATRFEDMYNIVDMIIDGQTIGTLLTFMKSAVLCAAAAFGWYLGSLMISYANRKSIC